MNVRNIPFKSAALSSAAAITLSAGLVTAPSAQAQTLTPVVAVCTGIRLDESLVVDIVGEVVQPVIGNVEDALDPLGLLDLGIDDTLAAAANGEYISLQVLSSDGTLVDPGESCNLAADGYSLNMPSGIEIGGNAITGLGAEDQGASGGTSTQSPSATTRPPLPRPEHPLPSAPTPTSPSTTALQSETDRSHRGARRSTTPRPA